jgi:methyl-accepting chemotaxis protein
VTRFSLSTKLAALVALLLLGVAAFLLFYFPPMMEGFSKGWVVRKAQDTAVLVSNGVASALEFDDEQSALDTLKGLERSDDALYAVVKKADGTRFAQWRRDDRVRDDVAIQSSLEGPRHEFNGGVIDIITPVHAKGGATGFLQMGFSLRNLQADRAKSQKLMLATSGIVLLIGCGLSLLIGFALVRPIVALTQVTSRVVNEGDLSQKIEAQSRDEVGELAASFARMLEKLRDIPLLLRGSVEELSLAVGGLTQLTRDQTAAVQRQAASLAEASATTQEIKQTSGLAATKAKTVFQIAEKAEEFSTAGQSAIEGSIRGLQDIRTQVDAIVTRIGNLSEQTLQVVIESVKDLADQSNVLALNAGIEAAKAGEFGKGFAVVAREMRSLADQSIQSTARIRDILSEIRAAIRATVSITDEGSRNMEQSMEQIRVSGENLREMTAIIQESSKSAQQIAASVSQQNAGIEQISAALHGLNGAMEETVRGIRLASGRISEIVNAFRV